MTRVFRRAWLPLLVIVAVAGGVVIVSNVRQVFGSNPVVITEKSSDNAEDFNPKFVTYEVFGSAGTGGELVYIDIDGHPHQVDVSTLPWSHTETTTLTVVSGSVSVHVHGGHVGCRMLVDGVVRDEQTSHHQDADVECRVKSA